MYKKAVLHFKKVDPILYQLSQKVTVSDLQPKKSYFFDLVDHIVSQQLSGKASATILSRILDLFPSKEITPLKLLEINPDKLRAAGLSQAKTLYVKDLAEKIHTKHIVLENLPKLDNETILKELILVKGIGVWTVEMFLMFTLGREDIFSGGDLGLKNALYKWYKTPEKLKPKEIIEFAKRWSPYRTYAAMILWKSLEL